MRLICLTLTAALFAGPAMAQLSVSTFGADDAAQCFQNAADDVSRDVAPCDAALRDKSTIRKDRIKTFVNRGIIHNRNGDLAKAVGDFDAALALDASVAEAFLNRGNSRFLARDYGAALADYERALGLGVSKPWAAWYNIGLVHDARKEKDKAREAYEKALALKPDFALAREKLERID